MAGSRHDSAGITPRVRAKLQAAHETTNRHPWQATFAQGVAAHRAGDIETARQLYCSAAETATDPMPARLLALLLSDDGQSEAAATWARRAVSLDPNAGLSHAALGRVLLQAGQLEDAERGFHAAISLDPGIGAAQQGLAALAGLQHRRGLALFHARQWHDAAIALAATARLLPESSDAWHDLGTVLHEGGHPAEAAGAYVRSTALAPDRADTWHNLGSVRQALHDMDGALAAYARAFALRPESFPRIAQELAAGNPGRVWLRAGDLRRVLARQ